MHYFRILFLSTLLTFLYSTNKVTAQQKNSSQEVYTMVEKMPKYPGGDSELVKYLKSNIKYPEKAKDQKIEGIVFVTFVINQRGKIQNAKVVGSVHPLLDEEALRLINSMPKWEPGEQKDQKVPVQFNLPVRFKINQKK